MTDYKSMFEQAVRTLAAIDEALGIGDDGCGDPDQTLAAIAELKAAKVGAGRPATVTREMIGAAHDVMLAKGDFILSASMLERIYMAMEQAAPAAVAGPSDAVAYIDIGAGGYLDLGSDLSDEALRKLPKGRHMLAIVGTYGVDGYAPVAAPTTQPEQVAQGDALDAAFDAVRQRLCGLQRYSFVLDDDDIVRRVQDRTGNWIEFDAAHELFDPVAVDAARSQAKEGTPSV